MNRPGNSDNDQKAQEWVFDPALVESRLKGWFPDLSPTVLKNLVTFQSEMIQFNKTVNLITVTTSKTIESTHLADCISAAKLIEKNLINDAPLYDFGGGNGLPGVVFGILWPKRKIILVDRDQRKLDFCKHTASTLKLSNISIEVKGVETLAEKSVLNAVARGFAPLPKALLTARKIVAKGGKFFHMKSDGWANELGMVPSQLFSFWAPSLLGQYKLPESSTQMSVVLTDKTAD